MMVDDAPPYGDDDEPIALDVATDHMPCLEAIEADPSWRRWHPDGQWPWEAAGLTPAAWLASLSAKPPTGGSLHA